MTDASGEIPQTHESYQIKCRHCGSTNFTCWDEQMEDFEDANGEIFEDAVGYMRCNDCNHSFLAYGPHDDGIKYLGRWDDDRECYR